jgi:hypothetical protein
VPAPRGEQRALVDEVGEVGAAHPGVPRASAVTVTSSAMGLLRRCTRRIPRARAGRARRPPPAGRSGPGAGAPGRARRGGWWRR